MPIIGPSWTGKIARCARSSACRRTTSARTSSRWCGHSASRSTPTVTTSSCWTTTRPTAPASSPTSSRRSCRGSQVLHRARKEGLGPAYIAGFQRALAEGAELVLEIDCDFSHDPGRVPRLIAACEDGADVALGSRWVDGRRHGQLGARPDARLARRQLLRAHHPRRAGARPDRRVQVLPPGRARDDRARRDHRQGLRRSRSRRPTARCGPGSRWSRSRSRSPTAASASPRWTARSWSRRCSRCRRSAGARCAAGSDAERGAGLKPAAHLHWCAWTRSPTRPSKTRSSPARCRSSSSSGRPGAGRARRSSRRSPRSPTVPRDASGSSSSTSTRTCARPRATACSPSRR